MIESQAARTVRGLSIAIIVVSALSLIDLAITNMLIRIFEDEFSGAAISVISGSLTVACIIICGVEIAGGILGVLAVKDRKKLDLAFSFAVVGAALSVLPFAIIRLILFVILAVKENNLKTEPVMALPNQTNGSGYGGQGQNNLHGYKIIPYGSNQSHSGQGDSEDVGQTVTGTTAGGAQAGHVDEDLE